GFRGSVINVSLGTQNTRTLEMAIESAYNYGIPMAAAAGNDNVDVKKSKYPAPCMYSDYLVCVGASDINYEKAWFSKYGSLVTMIAPGKDISAAGSGGDSDRVKKSGTSMAS
ncbi:peptidase S8/S53 domain-containing protein, partial [Mariannaea sp. PMI_226]